MGIRYTFYMPWYALVISVVMSVACGFFSAYIPYKSYFKNRYSLENGGSGTQALFSVFLWCARRTPCSFFIGYNSFQQQRSAALLGRLTKGISAFGAVLFEQSGSCQDLDEAIQVIKKTCLHHCKPVKTGFFLTHQSFGVKSRPSLTYSVPSLSCATI